jgi:DNA-directed RNA polymerase specialized sigma24 family protein
MAAPSRLDPLLQGYLSAPEHESQTELARLLAEQAQPIVEGILGCYQRRDLELASVVQLRLIERLHGLRNRPGAASIANFRGYVAVVTYRALAEQRRAISRERQRFSHDPRDDQLLAVPDPRSNAAVEVEQRFQLRALWKEIRQLPHRQCAALILNLRDEQGRSAVALLPLTGTASMRQIAAALAIPAARFAQLWNRLPIDDAAIAELLGVTRQQVVNLRKAARERLVRRMKTIS